MRKSAMGSLGAASAAAVMAVTLAACSATTVTESRAGRPSRQSTSTTVALPAPLGAADWLTANGAQLTGLVNAANGWTSSSLAAATSASEATNYRMCADVFSNNTGLGGATPLSDANLNAALQGVVSAYLKITAATNCLPYTPGTLRMSVGEDDDLTQANAALSAFEQALLNAVPGAILPPVNTSVIRPPPIGTVLAVSGSGATASAIDVSTASGSTEHTAVGLPFAQTLGAQPGAVSLVAQTADGSAGATITCSIAKPGEPVVTNTSTGPYAVVNCNLGP